MFTLCVANRDYTEWTFQAKQDQAKQDQAEQPKPEFSPLLQKLFHGDTIDASGQLIHSPYREKATICGVLLTSQKTYGRAGTKMLYKCVPDADHLPCFLVPYEEKYIGFQKIRTDKYISFRFKDWAGKHPQGLLLATFGPTEEPAAYLAYQLANQCLNDSMKTLNAMCLRALRENTLNPLSHGAGIEDRRTFHIISIDPPGCQDIDDAIGLRILPGGQTILSIYIANVPLMLEYYKLWPYLTERVATIYLPDQKIPMLPIALSENVCSLHEKTDRLAFVLDITLNKFQQLEKLSYTSALICVEKNYAYDSPELIKSTAYKQLHETVRTLNEEFAYVSKIQSSHTVVEYCMLRFNHECAKILQAKKGGIFRAATKKTVLYDHLTHDLKYILQNVAGEYCADAKPHELLGLDCYVHLSSPIRRMVDLVNMLDILEDTVPWSAAAKQFKEKWQGQIATINMKTKAGRKLQNEMELLQTYEKNPDRAYLGFIFEKTSEAGTTSEAGPSEAGPSEGMYTYKVYIAETKMLTKVQSPKEVSNYTTVYFSAHLFLDEAKMSKKIRLQII